MRVISSIRASAARSGIATVSVIGIVAVGVGVGDNVDVGVIVAVGDRVEVGVNVGEGDNVGVEVTVEVGDDVGVGVGVYFAPICQLEYNVISSS